MSDDFHNLKKPICIEQFHSEIYILSHLGGAGVKTSQCLAVILSFVKNSRAGDSTWLAKVILTFKEERVDHNGGVRALAPPQESIIYVES